MTTTIRDTASHLTTAITRLSLPHDRIFLFEPVHLRVEGGKVTSGAQSGGRDSVVRATLAFRSVEGDGEVTINPAEVLKFLKLYDSDEEVALEIGETVHIRGAKKSSTIHAEALTPKLPQKLPIVKDGILHWRGGTVPSDIVVEGAASEFARILDDAKVVEVKSYPFVFDEGASYVNLGGDEVKRNRVETSLALVGKGKRAEVTFGLSFAHVFTNLRNDKVRVHVAGGTGMGVFVNDEVGDFLYIVSARAEEKGREDA